MEIIIRVLSGAFFFGWGLIPMLLFSVVLGFILTALCGFFSEKTNRRMLLGVQCALSVWYCVQIIYHSFFGRFLIIYSIFVGGADQVIASGLVENTLGAILNCWWAFLVLALPIVHVVLYYRHFTIDRLGAKGGVHLLAGLCAFWLIVAAGYAVPPLREVQTDVFNKEVSVKTFGLLRAELMDIRCNLLGIGGKGRIEIVPEDTPVISPVPDEPQYEAAVMDIDFAALAESESDEQIKTLHSYFANEKPSMENEYTGMFEGYNLIQITAEGFSPYAIHPEITPTLYKMQQEGFNFTNFYTPLWEVSTFDGEYAATTGLIPKSGVWSYYQAGEEQMLLPFTMPQQYLNSGMQQVRAYHNHTYSYYHRDVSHTNLGYIYKGIGNGLEQVVNGKVWPESDIEMIEGTVGEYLDGKPFMTYYMTVSGHMEYGFDDNAMCNRHEEEVAHLPYTEPVRAYYACHIELDRAMEKLLIALKEAGVADKTLIVITPDHYPYGLEDSTEENPYLYIDEIAGHKVETNFELYKSSLIIYSPSMKEPVTVDKYCSSLDIIPTLNNLLGFEYDSRLLMGRDIFSDSEALVIFLNRSFITEKGKYNAETAEFELFAGQTLQDEQAYIERMKKIVSNKFKVSAAMLDHDYYRLVVDRERHLSK